MIEYKLIDSTTKDFEFLKTTHHITLKKYVAPIWGWDEQSQDKMFLKKFDPSKVKIIEVDGKKVGSLSVEHKSETIFLASILILPQFQNKKYGTAIVKDIIVEARQKHVPVTLTVLKSNPAKRLYERLGFKVIVENKERFFMQLDYSEI